MKIMTTAYLNEKAVVSEDVAFFQPDEKIRETEILNIYPGETFQTVLGFGGALTEAAGAVYAKLSAEKQQKLIDSYYGPTGLRYTLGRCALDSCDFCIDSYSADPYEEDTALKQFSLKRNAQFVFPLLDAVKQRENNLWLMLSPWSPPAYMKSTGERNHGGALLAQYRTRWAEYLCRYLTEYQKLGYPVSALSVQNEPNAVQPWESCVYSAQEEQIFLRDYLLPALHRNGLQNVMLTVWDHNKERLFDRVDAICSDAAANAAVGAAGFHWYSGDHFQALELVRRKYPDKLLIFTEGCIEYSHASRGSQLQNARRYAREMLKGFNAGLNAFLDWNILLDDSGGPNHKQNFCDAPVMASRDFSDLNYNLSYYYIGHFSRFIRPGALRLGVTCYTEKLGFAAFRNSNGSIAAVVLNQTEIEVPYCIRLNGQICPLCCPKNAISTLLIEPCEAANGLLF